MTKSAPSHTDRYFIINKPCNIVSQFISPHKVGLLGDLHYTFPQGIHAIGRLDKNSEGLLILTTNKKVTQLLFSGEAQHKRVYLVQVNNLLSDANLLRLRNGVSIRIEGGRNYATPACEVKIVEDPLTIYPQIQVTNQYGKFTWLLISLYEGKYRQVRKMINALHHRCKRLIRVSIEDLNLGNLPSGGVLEINEDEFFKKLHIVPR